jgi:exodeoxyribonuclease III
MFRQISLFENASENVEQEKTSETKILLWNIQNPSLERAVKQIEWIFKINPNILVLTEVKDSKGFSFIQSELEYKGYELVFNKCDSYFTVIALKNIKYSKKELHLKAKSERVSFVELETLIGKVNLIGIYAPTNSLEAEKVIIKKEFHNSLASGIKKITFDQNGNTDFIIGGDFNTLEPNHKPRYLEFEKWFYVYNFFESAGFVDIHKSLYPNKTEYTWERQGKSQRLDYAFASRNIQKYVTECNYIHFPRQNGLSDHSAMLITLDKI